jgi:hypothetical protein
MQVRLEKSRRRYDNLTANWRTAADGISAHRMVGSAEVCHPEHHQHYSAWIDSTYFVQ